MFDPAWVTEHYEERMDCEGKYDADQYRKITFWWLERGNALYIFPPVCSRDFVRYMDTISGWQWKQNYEGRIELKRFRIIGS